jgi:hypothetical protein
MESNEMAYWDGTIVEYLNGAGVKWVEYLE